MLRRRFSCDCPIIRVWGNTRRANGSMWVRSEQVGFRVFTTVPGILQYDDARIVAVCDLDAHRVADGRNLSRLLREKDRQAVRGREDLWNYHDYWPTRHRAVVISTPDHWHAITNRRGACAARTFTLQKPASLTICGRAGAGATRCRRLGAFCRSGANSARRCNFATRRNTRCRMGALVSADRVEIGLPGESQRRRRAGKCRCQNLNYDMCWVQHRKSTTRRSACIRKPVTTGLDGCRCEQFGAGHDHGLGSASCGLSTWGMNTEYTGPVKVEGWAEFPTDDCGTCTVTSYRGRVCKRRTDEDQRRLSEWDQILRDERLDFMFRAGTKR